MYFCVQTSTCYSSLHSCISSAAMCLLKSLNRVFFFLVLLKSQALPQKYIKPTKLHLMPLCSETFKCQTRGVSHTLTHTERRGPGSLYWSCSSRWMWLITDQLADGTCANSGAVWESRQLKWESVALSTLLLQNCFNDFPTSCFIFMSSVLSVYWKGLPASKNDQLCMPLNMYICAFVYPIGVHWYFFLSSRWFTKKTKASLSFFVKLLSLDGVRKHDPSHDFLCDITENVLPATVCQPINTICLPLSLQGHFLWHLRVSKSFYSEAFWLSHSWLMIRYYTLNWQGIGTWWKSSIHRERRQSRGRREKV